MLDLIYVFGGCISRRTAARALRGRNASATLKVLQPVPAQLGMCGELERMGLPADRELDAQVRRRKVSGPLLRPFDEPQVPRLGPVAQTQSVQLCRVAQPVEIGVHDREAVQRVELDERVGRAAHRTRYTAGAQEAARQRRLARAEFAAEENHGECLPRRARARQSRPQCLRLPFRAGLLTHAPLQRLTQWCSSRVRSLASTPRSPARAAASPASACTSTPTRAAAQWS